MPDPTSTPPVPVSVDDYGVPGSYDEAFTAPGQARAPYVEVMAGLAGVDLRELSAAVNAHVAARGLVFGGDEPRDFHVDPVPRLIGAEEWADLTAGLAQRVRALDLFLDDVYGDRAAIREGIVPESAVTGTRYLEADLAGLRPAAGARISIAGMDLVRGADGRVFVLEDNVRTPSGITYALAASEAVTALSPLEGPLETMVDSLRVGLRGAMEATAPHVEGELVLLTDGPGNSAWYEHQRLAELCDLTLVRIDDLRRADDRVELADGRRVRALYRRTDEDVMRDAAGRPTRLVQLLLEPLRAGTVGMVNWFGTGVADDKEVYAFVDDLVRFYLDEQPLLGSVPTFQLTRPGVLEQVLDRIAELVVKPRDGHGGQGVVVGPAATRDELAQARRWIQHNPSGWIAQEAVALSTHPTVVDGRLVPRHVDLRPFVFYDGTDVVVPPGGLTRVALQEGSMIVNSSRQGGGKPTWVLGRTP